jgi:hypothetical protein
MKNNSLPAWQLTLIGGLCLFAILFLLFGCATEKKANKYFDKHPREFAEKCRDSFPVIAIIGKSDTQYIKADNKDYTHLLDSVGRVADSLNTYWLLVLDSSTDEVATIMRKELLKAQKEAAGLKEIIGKLRSEYKPCKADTVRLTATNYLVDGAAVAAERLAKENAQKELKATSEKLDRTKDRLSWWKIACLVSWLVISVGVIIKLLLKKAPVKI